MIQQASKLKLVQLKRLIATHTGRVDGKWPRWELRTSTRDLVGKTVGLIGFGHVPLTEETWPGHPLTRLDNVVLTPHIAAGTLDAFRTKMRFALANIARVMNGGEPLERVPGT